MKEEFDFYSKTSLKSYNLDELMAVVVKHTKKKQEDEQIVEESHGRYAK